MTIQWGISPKSIAEASHRLHQTNLKYNLLIQFSSPFLGWIDPLRRSGPGRSASVSIGEGLLAMEEREFVSLNAP